MYLIENRARVVSKDDLLTSVWGGRSVSESTLTSRINAVRKAVGDNGAEQRLIQTLPRKGVRFVGPVQEQSRTATESTLSLELTDGPSLAVLPFQNLSVDREQEYFADGSSQRSSQPCVGSLRSLSSRATPRSPTKGGWSISGRSGANLVSDTFSGEVYGKLATACASSANSFTRKRATTSGRIVTSVSSATSSLCKTRWLQTSSAPWCRALNAPRCNGRARNCPKIQIPMPCTCVPWLRFIPGQEKERTRRYSCLSRLWHSTQTALTQRYWLKAVGAVALCKDG